VQLEESYEGLDCMQGAVDVGDGDVEAGRTGNGKGFDAKGAKGATFRNVKPTPRQRVGNKTRGWRGRLWGRGGRGGRRGLRRR